MGTANLKGRRCACVENNKKRDATADRNWTCTEKKDGLYWMLCNSCGAVWGSTAKMYEMFRK